ncbi:MAG TPA: hypothetical protein VEB59_13765 [Gemmatimonadales bacterium]|nr:hypothetical protein [Gemmatimonadales bacterium]
MTMRLLRTFLPALILFPAPLAAQTTGGAGTVFVVAPDVAGSRDEALSRLAQRFTARLIQSLGQAEVATMRVERARLDSLLRARAAGLALDATLGGPENRRSAQLRLIDVATGDELRAYMFGPGDDEGVLGLAERAAPRIAAAMKEEQRTDR